MTIPPNHLLPKYLLGEHNQLRFVQVRCRLFSAPHPFSSVSKRASLKLAVRDSSSTRGTMASASYTLASTIFITHLLLLDARAGSRTIFRFCRLAAVVPAPGSRAHTRACTRRHSGRANMHALFAATARDLSTALGTMESASCTRASTTSITPRLRIRADARAFRRSSRDTTTGSRRRHTRH